MKSSLRRNCNRHRTTSELASIESLEERVLLSAGYRSIDGWGNNGLNPDWGSTDIHLRRAAPAEYGDGTSTLGGTGRPSARVISNAVSAQTGSVINELKLTDFVWQWGQFLDHDIDLTDAAEPHESAPIDVPAGDPFFDPFNTGTVTIGLNRSTYDGVTGTSPANPRQQINQITAFIDASNVYGSDAVRADALRTFAGGRLKTSTGDLLPFNTTGLPNAGGPLPTLFLAGDVRANEQTGLTAMHTLFVREHNRLASEIEAAEPWLNDEDIYQKARKIVGAQMQAITYNEFLPVLLGPDAIPDYAGYNPTVNPGINNEFSTAAYRFGHSMLSAQLLRLNDNGDPIAAGHLSLRDAFFSPQETIDHGIEPVLRGLAAQLAQKVDTRVIDDVRNFLFGPPGSGGMDLASANIQRGRDHGLPDYNTMRVAYGLAPVTSFADITTDVSLQQTLASLYGTVDNIDAWVGALAEDHVHKAAVGELLQASLADQFIRLRDGDRYWYETQFYGVELQAIRYTRLSDIILRNTTISDISGNVFIADTQAAIVGRSDNGAWWVARSNGTDAFENELWGVWSASVDWQHTHVADVNGDGKDDVVGWQPTNGAWWVALSDGSGFTNQKWGYWAPIPWTDVAIADVNGDGRDDIVGRQQSNGAWWVALSDGSGFTNQKWGGWTAIPWDDVAIADVNGDGRDDIVGRQQSNGAWWVALSTGSSFVNQLWGGWAPIPWIDVNIADVNDDGRDDIVGRQQSTGAWWVALSTGATFVNQLWGGWAPVGWLDVAVADVNGDGLDDIVGRQQSNGAWWAALSNGSSFSNELLGRWTPINWVDVNVMDVDGDGHDDVVGRDAASGNWWVARSECDLFNNERWGAWDSSTVWQDVGTLEDLLVI